MKNLLRLYRKLKSDRWLLFEAFCWLNLIRLGLALLSFSRLKKFLDGLVVNGTPKLSQNCFRSPIKIVQAINTSDRYSLTRAKCLAKALTTRLLLSKSGHVCDLKIGVLKTESGALNAHAWIIYEKKILIGNLPNLSNFVSLTSL